MDGVEDDRLRLIFTCCHPALAADAQVALTLREVCGLPTEEIAAAFLTRAPTLAQRIVRAKTKIRDARIPYEMPAGPELAERLESVLRVIYLVFNKGYAASSGESLTRHDLSHEAIRLGRLLVQLLPEPVAIGLLALMLLHDSRRATRTSAARPDRGRRHARGARAPIRTLWPLHAAGRAGRRARTSAHRGGDRLGRIVGLYDALIRLEPSPVVELNRAVAVAMRDGPEAGLMLVDGLRRPESRNYFGQAVELPWRHSTNR